MARGTQEQEFVPVLYLEDLQPGMMYQVLVDGVPLCVCNVNGEIYAVSDICSHEEVFLSYGRLDGYDLECPLHASIFDVRTGVAEVPPAERSIPTYPVRVIDGIIEVSLTR